MRHLTRAVGFILISVGIFWLVNIGGWWRLLSVVWLWAGGWLSLRGHAAAYSSRRRSRH
jgi:hypothetical protein